MCNIKKGDKKLGTNLFESLKSQSKKIKISSEAISNTSLTVPMKTQNAPFQFKELIPEGGVSFATAQTPVGNTALLFIGPRRRMAKQIIRPLTYNFNNTFLNSLNTIMDGVPVKSIDHVNPLALNSIIPAFSGGNELNVNLFEECFSFILHVTQRAENGMGNYQNSPTLINIYSGYFVDEPLSPNGLINEYAKFFITNTSVITQSNFSSFGRKNGISLTSDTTTITNELERQMKRNEPLFWNTISDLTLLPDTSVIQNNTGHLSRLKVNNLDGGANGSKNIGKVSTIPSVLINSVVETAKQWKFNRENESDDLFSSISDNAISLDTFNINHELQRRIPAISLDSENVNWGSGLDEHHVHLLGELTKQYGQNLKILNIQLRNPNVVANGHEIDQTLNSKQNQFSYMLSYCIEPIATRSCINSITFEFHSHVATETIMLTRSNPQWIIQDVRPISNDIDQNMLRSSVAKFQKEMEEYVFSSIKSFLGDGDFSLWVIYNQGSVVDINLKLHDFSRYHQNGFYESYNHLAPMTIPLVGNVETIVSNKSSLDSLKNALLTM